MPENKEQYIDLSNLIYTAKQMTVAIKLLAESMSVWSYKMIELCPNKRIVYLALHGKKKRTRKKNINRIKKYLKRRENS